MSRTGVEVKSPEQVRLMRRAGLVVADALEAVVAAVRPGTTTRELDAVAAEVMARAGAQPSFLGYGAEEDRPGFPGVLCLSVDDEVVHGIPGDRVLAAGDLLSIDCGAVVDGWHGDAAVSVVVGPEPPRHEVAGLLDATRTAMWHGIAALRPDGRVADVGRAVEAAVRAAGPYGIVDDYVGHGIGTAMHQEPDVPNRAPHGLLERVRGRGPRLVPGTVLAVEPMLTLGSPETHELDDGWTAVTDDGGLACHFEHTVALTPAGLWVLTAHDGGEAALAALGAPYAPL
ncbi:methionine aminopeptidase, type I [Microlunatus sagamiharensis]|uniref:Methionine aminopeptidase n=1 Tax=Microlunatus sagamiharensis TaxID=546874 RepID=A0A1H2MX30_9ACTN|nr:type I methionyl aminopeptidase [Microlunatus sagamiharensis]SDU97654.1 methionine aminopeptidase, type I [Microlunatus sagamiharensis]